MPATRDDTVCQSLPLPFEPSTSAATIRPVSFPLAPQVLSRVSSDANEKGRPRSNAGTRRTVVNQTLAIRVLGGFEVLKGKNSQSFPQSRKTRGLLAYLILTGRRHRRERLCELLWDVPDDPRASLRWSLSRLRSLVDEAGHERIVADREYVFFDPKGATVDLLEVRRELAGGSANAFSTQHLLDLAAQFRGELLEGLAITDHQDFESWLLTERETARRTRASLLHILVNRLYAEAPEQAIQHARHLIVADPYSVSAHAMLIRILSASGHREEAEHQLEVSTKELSNGGARDFKALTDALVSRRSAVRSVAVNHELDKRLEQEIRFCTTSDRVRIAYATVGEGPPLIKTANWLNHLEYDWDSPIWCHVFRGLARDHRFIRYDARSNGLSDWDVEEISFDAFVRDLESVVNAAGVERFPLLGISQGCAISIEYAIRNPGRVTRLVLHGGYATGWRVGADLAEIARREAMQTLILHGWGQDNPAFRQVFTSAFIPDGTPEQFRWMNELMRISTSPPNAIRLQQALSNVDIRDRLSKVNVPTLVLHSRNDGRIPYRKGLELAHGIPNARLITLESNNHLLLEHEAEFPRFMEAILAFLNEG
jgi:pimeloyl-ACP methyl ester carboxylesterase/DNA-binding SARP family transcriptional activator